MKLTLRILAICSALLSLASVASAVPGRAEVKSVVNGVTVTKAGGRPSPVTVGTVLGTGDTISTSAKSSAGLWLGVNGEALMLAANTTVVVEELEIVDAARNIVTTRLHVTKGKAYGVVKNKLAAASKYEIKSPKGSVARIVGTQWAFKDDGTLVVLEGKVTYTYVENGQSKSVEVSAGQQFKVGDPAPSTYTPSLEITPAVLSAFAEVLENSGVSLSNPNNAAEVIAALASALDISRNDLVSSLVAAGVAKETVIQATNVQPLDPGAIVSPDGRP